MSITAERLMVEVRADTNQAVAGLKKVDATSSSLGKRIGGLSRTMGFAFGGTAIVGGLVKTINLAKDFDLTMRQVGVQTGQTGDKLAKLSDVAKQMGADTIYSAQDAGSAMLELAKGGLTAAQLKAGALETTLTLAAAGGLDLANSAGYVTQAMTTFGLKAAKANQVAVALAGGANASTASVESLGQALSQVGPGATNAGLSLQDTVGALAAFDNAGIKGSDAGTSLKTMLTNLVPATSAAADKMDELGISFVKRNGDFKSLTQISGILKARMSDLSQEQRTYAMRTIFGSDATRAATVLMKNGSEGIRKYIKATRDKTAVEDMANAAMDGASGAWENLTGSVETAAISLGQKLLPMFTKAANAGADLVSDAGTWGPQLEDTFGGTIKTAKVFAGVLLDVGGVAVDVGRFIGGLPDPVKDLGVQAVIAAAVLPRLSGAITSVTGTVGTNIRALQQWKAELTYTSTRTQAATTAMTKLGGAAKAAAGVGGMLMLSKSTSETNENLAWLERVGGSALTGLAVAGPIGAAAGALIGMATATREVKDLTKGLDAVTAHFTDTLDENTGAVTRATRTRIFDNLMADENTAAQVRLANAYGVSTRDIVGSAMGQEDSQRRLSQALAVAKGKWEGLTYSQRQHQRGLASTIDALEDLTTTTRNQRTTLAGDLAAADAKTRATQSWTEALRGVPKEVRSNLKAENYDLTRRQVDQLVERYDLIPKQKKTILTALGLDKAKNDLEGMGKMWERVPQSMKDLGIGDAAAAVKVSTREIAKNLSATKKQYSNTQLRLFIRATGSDTTVAQVRQAMKYIRNDLTATGKVKVDPSPFRKSFTDGVAMTRRDAQRLMRGLKGDLQDGTKSAKPNLSAYIPSLLDTLGRAKGAASSGGNQVGANLASGAASGIASHSSLVSIAASAAVRSAIAAMRKAADSHSPSRETAKVGKDMGLGLEGGMVGRAKGARDAGRGLVKSTLDGMRDPVLKKAAGDAGKKTAEEHAKAVKAAKKKAHDAGVELMKSVVSAFRSGEQDARRVLNRISKYAAKSLHGDARERVLKLAKRDTEALGKLYDRQKVIAAKLAAAQSVLENRRSVKASFVDSTFGGMNSQATVIGAGWDASTIASTLTGQVAKVKEFAALLLKLRKMKYNPAIIEQIAGAGVEGGMDAARALAAASGADQATINSAYSAIRNTASSTSKALGASMYDSGIRAAEGLVAGLKKKKKDVEDAILAIAMAMQKALKKALGIKSPSRVMAKLGAYSAQGLVQGMLGEEQAVGAASTRLASIMARPVGLATYAKSPASPMSTSGAPSNRAIQFHFNTVNPIAEAESTTTNKALARVASLGLV